MKNWKSIVALLLLVVLVPCSTAEFTEYPMNVTLPVGSETSAVFRCRHQSLEALISWKVNGLLWRRFPNITASFLRENGIIVDLLTIPTITEYNGTEVECEAIFRNGSLPEVTPPATLTIIAAKTEAITTTIQTIDTPTTTVAETTTTTQIASNDVSMTVMTTEEPTTVTFADFIQVPYPPLVIVSLEERYTYMCNNSMTSRIYWRVNNSRLNVDIFPAEIDPVIIPLANGLRLYTLKIGGLSEHNKSTIQCVAEFEDRSVKETPVVTFLIQGQLDRVCNIMRNTSTISWEAPFTLNLTNVEPDIVYCVEVYNITCGRSLLISECDVTETGYTNDALLPGYIFEYTVTPRSNVEGASNGISLTVIEIFSVLKLASKGHGFTLYAGNRSDMIMVTIHLDIQDTQSRENQILADSYSVYLKSLDDENSEMEFIPNIESRNESSLIFQLSLPFRRLWNYTILANGCEGNPVMDIASLSTHDVQDVSITSPFPGKVRVSGNFIKGSTATGVLVAILSTSEINFDLVLRDGHQLQLAGTISNVEVGWHLVSMFVVDKNGLPVNRAATVPQNIFVEKGHDTQNLLIEYELSTTSTGICITCTFLDSSTTGCVAVVLQQINSSGLMNIESSHKFNRSGDTAYGCIEGVNLEHYQVGVLEGLRKLISDSKDSSLCIWCIVGSTVVPLMAILGIVILMIICVMLKARKYTSGEQQFVDPPDNVNIELQKCGAYEVVQLSKQGVSMNNNPAYGEIGVGSVHLF